MVYFESATRPDRLGRRGHGGGPPTTVSNPRFKAAAHSGAGTADGGGSASLYEAAPPAAAASSTTTFLSAFGGGNKGVLYGELVSFGQIPGAGADYEAVFDVDIHDNDYDNAQTYQLEAKANELYLETKASKLTRKQQWTQLADMTVAMSFHQEKYDELFEPWSRAAWVADLDRQHATIVGRLEKDGAAAAVVQPNPWAAGTGQTRGGSKGYAVTSKQYMLKLLETYTNQTSPTSPVALVVGGCTRIAAMLGIFAVTFALGPIKKQARIFEKVLTHGGRFDMLRDYARATFSVKMPEVLPELLKLLSEAAEFEVVRVKNRLSTLWDPRDSAGYRDCQVLVRTKEGWLVELQLIPEAMHQLKLQLGHGDYVRFRFIIEAGMRARAKAEDPSNNVYDGGDIVASTVA